ncbi:MAG TPA: hydroxyacid dehydrogenase [Bdellovibrionales bacterium]|nr:MAG: hydroxyacid dehydrogenase [Bdellovibrionales bacterium GWB1_52_6]OFZ03799.1 MAG: hydroxyacid dehydrogenase [Bdellovibrionales bacterium GWA1_52_35]OFZ38712.1 MAG: hydroxyacid dehydrogenase [Bdellovibrionales bacterium GWC1_52_8]HAR43253.1 hydroxyacid dehydrogenase [Bdellovibrionales bacterium]HCM40209.1 hydroxyacid dehydrogenase [Bdellovibrionales bacterium]
MKIANFDTHDFERKYLAEAAKHYGHAITYIGERLSFKTAGLAEGHPVVCAFVNDSVDEQVLRTLKDLGVRLIALRSAGFNNVDLPVAAELGLPVVRVPEYSPYAVAEHAVALILALNRKISKGQFRVKQGNFSLSGLLGFDLHGKTVGVVGTGKIGSAFARIMSGFGCRVLAMDSLKKPELITDFGVKYVDMERLLRESDIISLHVPLTPKTRHLINSRAFELMRPGVMLINTGRGALIETRALIRALKTHHVGYAGLDAYEEEENVFFQDLSEEVLQDDLLARLLMFPNVLITAHQGFLTEEALLAIAETTMANVSEFEQGKALTNEIIAEEHWKDARAKVA